MGQGLGDAVTSGNPYANSGQEALSSHVTDRDIEAQGVPETDTEFRAVPEVHHVISSQAPVLILTSRSSGCHPARSWWSSSRVSVFSSGTFRPTPVALAPAPRLMKP